MKNWAMIAIFLIVMVLSAAAQQPSKPQAAIINPGEPSTIASEKPVLPALPSALKSSDSLPRSDAKNLTEDLTEYQREQIEGHNQQLKEHFTAQQQPAAGSGFTSNNLPCSGWIFPRQHCN